MNLVRNKGERQVDVVVWSAGCEGGVFSGMDDLDGTGRGEQVGVSTFERRADQR